MKELRIDLRIRRYLNIENLIKRAKSLAVIGPALIVLVYGSALPTYSRSGAGNLGQASELSLNQWTSILPGAGITELAIDRTNPNIIYAGSDIGVVFKTTDVGATWTSSSTPAQGYTRSLAIDFVNPSNVYAGTLAGVFKSTDGGASWPNQSSPNATFVVMEPQSPNTLYASVGNTNIIWKTTDGGASWPVLPTGDLRLLPSGWAISPANPQIIYAPGYLASVPGVEMYKSTDGGAGWSATGLVNSGTVFATAIDPYNPNVVYASSIAGWLFKSTDGGANWLSISEGLDLHINSWITSIAISPTDPNTLYVGTFHYDEPAGVFHSTNGGASWSEFNDGLTALAITDLAIDSSGSSLYAATFQGVYRYQFVPHCAAQISPTNHLFSSAGGAGSVNVTAGSQCHWDVSNNANWITITSPASSTGPGTVTFEVRENFTASSRTTTVLIAGQNLTVVQNRGGCNYLIPPRFQTSTFSASGGAGTINISTESQCAWQAVSNASWITITSNSVGIASGTVAFSVGANPTGSGRRGTITIAGQTLPVKQMGN